MANSGSKSIAVTSYDSLKFSWSEKSQSVANNTTTIDWKMELIATANGRISSTASKKWSVTVNGTNYSGTITVGIAASATKTLASGSTTIKHNSNGTKTFSYEFSQEFNITFSGSKIDTKTGSGNGTLDTIPRQATLTSAPNFNDEGNPVIKYTNPAGNSVQSLKVCISLDGSTDDIAYRDVDATGTSYTFSLTDAERDVLRKATKTSNSRKVRFYIWTILGGNNYRHYLEKEFSIVNANPIVNPTVADVGTVTTALTGDANKIIKYYNYVSVNSGASAQKGADISSYSIKCGNKSISTASGSLTNVESADFIFTVKDSRGNITTKTVKKTLINYVKLTCNLNVDKPAADGKVTFMATGAYYNGSFGTTNNTLQVQYRYKISGGSYSSWTNLTPTINGNAYAANGTVTGLDYRETYVFQARAIDKNSSGGVNTGEQTVIAKPIFDWGSSDFNFNVPVYVNGLNLSGAAKALTTSYQLETTVTAGENYTTATGTAYLVGNMLRCTMNLVRATAPEVGNITNETCCTYKIYHNGKIKEVLYDAIVISATGGVAAFSPTGLSYDSTDNSVSFRVTLNATTMAGRDFSSYFSLPVVIDLDKY